MAEIIEEDIIVHIGALTMVDQEVDLEIGIQEEDIDLDRDQGVIDLGLGVDRTRGDIMVLDREVVQEKEIITEIDQEKGIIQGADQEKEIIQGADQEITIMVGLEKEITIMVDLEKEITIKVDLEMIPGIDRTIVTNQVEIILGIGPSRLKEIKR